MLKCYINNPTHFGNTIILYVENEHVKIKHQLNKTSTDNIIIPFLENKTNENIYDLKSVINTIKWILINQ